MDKAYAKSIPPSLHSYYHMIYYWYKASLIAQRHGTPSMDQERLIHFIRGYGGAKIACGTAEYLEGLWDLRDAAGVKHLLHITEPNLQGHFGQATALTHSNYEMLPAPAIFLARIIEDVTKTTGRIYDPGWIPHAIRQAARRAQPQAQRKRIVNPEDNKGGLTTSRQNLATRTFGPAKKIWRHNPMRLRATCRPLIY